MADAFMDVGTTIAIKKGDLDHLIARLDQMGYEVVGPQVRDNAIIHGSIKSISELPVGYRSHQESSVYKLQQTNQNDYFGVHTGPQSWKQFFFPPKHELMRFQKQNGNNSWSIQENSGTQSRYAMIGVRPCDLAAIQVQDEIFIQDEWSDPVYSDCRSNAFIMTVNCLEPCGNGFCASMGTGPDATSGFDLCLSELEDHFLIEIGSEVGKLALNDEGINCEPASAYLLLKAQTKLEDAREGMLREISDPDLLRDQLLKNLDHPQYNDIGNRCMSCASCTQVCPTCFCWDTYDNTLLPGDVVIRERVWDSCFNPDYTYVFGGNTRPSSYSRYRQWLTHKFASWHDQFGVSGCVGCGRCITWCPAGIDHLEEINIIRAGEPIDGGRA